MHRLQSLCQLFATAVVLLIGLLLPYGELLLDVPLLRLGRSMVASPAPSVFLYDNRLQFDLVVTSQQPDDEVVIAGNEGFQQRIRGPFWRRAVYLNAFHLGRADVLEYAFFRGGDLGKDFDVHGTVKQIVVRQWDADITPIDKYSVKFFPD